MCDDGAFLGETFNVLRLLCEITQRNEKRKVSVAMASSAKHPVELTLHIFPYPVTPRANHHATAHVRRLGQFRRADDLLIPFRKIFVPSRCDCGLCGSRI